ncbi:hypothetical protein [Carboxylicivirga caseinilyticus]|uniref:hypothetical protein n=1 Tax=Carboxylicivirga caseinilyticus TaxID=3417572 RepID=UPI003D32944B|nr:hypothetical protein [Marinilabiliaceae bacterium A049]
MRFSISIDHKHKIIRYKHSGIIQSEDIEEAWAKFLKMPEFTQMNYDLLSDYRHGRFNIVQSQLVHIIEFLQAVEPIIKGKKQALIVDDPYSVAASMIFVKEVYEKLGFIVKVFATEEAAFNWIRY